MSNDTVLLVEDDDALRQATAQALELSGFAVQAYDSAARAARFLTPGFSGCIVSDIRMEGMDGLQLFDRARALDSEIPVILITGHGDIEMAVRAMRDGVFDFLAKPFSTDHLLAVVRNAIQSRRLVLDNRALRRALDAPSDDLVAQSPAMRQLRSHVVQIASSDMNIVFEGEAGTGKEIWARQLHRHSGRYAGPFLVYAAMGAEGPNQLVAQAENARNGTLFIDDCQNLSDPEQASLIALIDAKERSDANGDQAGSFRLIAASSLPLSDTGLRQELLHKLGTVRLRVPPLRERRDDIPMLFAGFVREALDRVGKKRFDMTTTDRKRLLEHDWPGNVRELRNYAVSAVLNLPRQSLSQGTEKPGKDFAKRVAEFEQMIISEALQATNGHVVRACALLQMPRKTFYDRLARYRIDPSTFRTPQPREQVSRNG